MKSSLGMLAYIFRGWQRHLGLQLATAVVLVAGFTVVCGVITIGENTVRIMTLWGDSMQMSVYFTEKSTPENISAVQKYVEETHNFNPPKEISKEEGLKNFREQIASFAPDILNDEDILRFIPSSMQLSVRNAIPYSEHLALMQQTADALRKLPGVDDVNFGQEWVKNCAAILNVLDWAGTLFVLVILVSAVLVMANSISSSIHQRRQEIEVLELVGATPKYIRLPFIVEGAMLGAFSILTSLVVTYGLFKGAQSVFQNQVAFLQLSAHIRFLNPSSILFLTIGATGLGALSAWTCVRRLNTGWAASQHLGEA